MLIVSSFLSHKCCAVSWFGPNKQCNLSSPFYKAWLRNQLAPPPRPQINAAKLATSSQMNAPQSASLLQKKNAAKSATLYQENLQCELPIPKEILHSQCPLPIKCAESAHTPSTFPKQRSNVGNHCPIELSAPISPKTCCEVISLPRQCGEAALFS